VTKLADFSSADLRYVAYGGADGKDSIYFNGKYYLLKYPKKLPQARAKEKLSYTNSPTSEHLGCEIFKSVGIDAQNTILGTCDGKIVVACEDFIENHPDNSRLRLQEFNTMINSMVDFELASGTRRTAELSDIEQVFLHHRRLSQIKEEAICAYWDMFVVDALIANFDRHTGNWGYITNLDTGEINLAPVYDCGASLFSQLDDRFLIPLLNNKGELNNYILNMPTAPFSVDGLKVTYREFLNHGCNENMQAALDRVVPRIDIGVIAKLIDTCPGLSDARKEFLLTIVPARLEKVLVPAYQRNKDKPLSYSPPKKEPLSDRIDRAQAAAKAAKVTKTTERNNSQPR